MKRVTVYYIFLFTVITSCSSKKSEGFSLIVTHYGGGGGTAIIYSVDNTGLQIDTNCDLVNCKQATVYKRIFSKSESDSIIVTLNSLRLDTLKTLYRYKDYYDDGFYVEIKFQKSIFSSYKSTFDNLSTPTADSLYAYIDKLVTEPKYRLATWGQTE